MKEHDFLLNVNVSKVDYEKAMGQLRRVEDALILLMVDMFDIPASIYAQLHQLIGAGKPMIVLGWFLASSSMEQRHYLHRK